MPLAVLAQSLLSCKTHRGCGVFVVDVVITWGRWPLKLMNSFFGNLRLIHSFISKLFLCCFLLPESIALGEIGLLKLSPSSSFALFRLRVCTPVSIFLCTAKYSHTSWTKSRCDFVLNVHVYKFSGAFIPIHRRYAYASDHKTAIFPCFFVYFSPLFQLCLPLTNKIDQKWPTTSHRRWCYTTWNALIARIDTRTYLFYNITNFHIIWYTPWYFLIILARNADT